MRMRAYLLGQDLNVPVSVISVVGAKGAGLNTISAPSAGGAKVFASEVGWVRLCRDRCSRCYREVCFLTGLTLIERTARSISVSLAIVVGGNAEAAASRIRGRAGRMGPILG